jgi:MYXO-CTERM domain-containing protein
MIRPSVSLFGCAITALLLGQAPARAEILYPDPTGDTFGTSSLKLDITAIGSTLTATTLSFRVVFASPIAPPSAFATNSAVGFVDIDTDQNPGTAGPGGHPSFGPGLTGLGTDFYLDLFSEAFSPGFVDVIDTATGFPTGSAPITFGSNFLRIDVPLSLLGNDDGRTNYGVTAGTFVDASDVARNAGLPPAFSGPEVQAVPEPAGVVLALTGLLGLLGLGRRRRSRTLDARAACHP